MLPDPDASPVLFLQDPFSYLICGVYKGKRRSFPPDPWVLHCSWDSDSACESDVIASSRPRVSCDVSLAERWGVSCGACGELVAPKWAG